MKILLIIPLLALAILGPKAIGTVAAGFPPAVATLFYIPAGLLSFVCVAFIGWIVGSYVHESNLEAEAALRELKRH